MADTAKQGHIQHLKDTKRDLLGKPFGKLKVVGETDQRDARNEVIWRCECECGNEVFVATSLLTRGSKKSCGCLRGRQHTTDHNNRDCREAVTLALYLARIWNQDQYVLFGHSVMRYVIHSTLSDRPGKTGRNTQTCYKVTSSGEVVAFKGYPDYATLFAARKEGK